MKTTTKNICIALLCVLAIIVCPSVAAQGNDHQALLKYAGQRPLAEVMNMAKKEMNAGNQQNALLLYTVIGGRYNDNISAIEKAYCSEAYILAGNIYFNSGDYAHALEADVKGLKISEASGHTAHTARHYNNIANVYGVFHDYEKSIDYYKKALEANKLQPNRELQYKIAVNLTGTYTLIGNLKEAERYYGMSEKLKNASNPEHAFMGRYMHGLINLHNNKTVDAISEFKALASQARSQQVLNPRYLCFAYQSLYQAYMQTSRRDSVLTYLTLCLKTAQDNHILHLFSTTLCDLSSFYEQQGNISTANDYKARYLAVQDSIFNIREFDIVKNMQFQYEVDKTAREFDEIRAREQEKIQTIRWQRAVMGLTALCAIIVLTALLIVLRQKKKLTRSYFGLYALNRDFINRHKEMTERHQHDLNTIKEKDKEIYQLNEKVNSFNGAQKTGNSTEADKYQSSNLKENQRQTLEEAITHVMENTLEFCNPDFSLDALAALVGSNSKYVSQTINDTFSKNFNNYINTYRIHLACQRLADEKNYGNLTLKGIAESVGFRSHTSFVNIFKKITGITPSLYRKMAHEDNTPLS